MKNIIKTVACFGLLFVYSKGLAMAAPLRIDGLLNDTIKTEPVPIVVTPTSILIKPIKQIIDIDIKPLATKTPTPIIVTQVVTATPNPTVSVTETKPTETEKTTTITPIPIETVILEPTIEEVEKIDEMEEKTNSDKWFWGVIIGLLALILAVQVWSTKEKKGDGDKQNDI